MDPSLMPLPVGIVAPPDLVSRYTASFELSDRLHLERLMASWSLLADFSFSDLLLFVPITRDGEEGDEGVSDLGVAGVRAPVPGQATLDGLVPFGEPAPSSTQALEDHEAQELAAFVVLGQIRPTTSQTLYEVDLVGQVQAAHQLPSIVEAYQTGAIVRG